MGHAGGAVVDAVGSLWGCGGGKVGLWVWVTAGALGLARGGPPGAWGGPGGLVGSLAGALRLAMGLEVGGPLLHLQGKLVFT